jgi:hypothetical protein
MYCVYSTMKMFPAYIVGIICRAIVWGNLEHIHLVLYKSVYFLLTPDLESDTDLNKHDSSL